MNAEHSGVRNFDVIVVGGGIAGLASSVRAAQLGLRVALLEKGEDEHYACNTRFSGGAIHTCFREVMKPESVLLDAIHKATRGFAREDLVQAIAQDGRRLVRWLQDQGIQFMKASTFEYHTWTLAPPWQNKPGVQWEGRGADTMLRRLTAKFYASGGVVQRGTRARRLVMSGQRCAGVETSKVDGSTMAYEARAVVIADGGFQGNPDLLQRYVTPQPARLKQRGAGTSAGDGMLMAREVGAAITALESFYGHVLCRDAMHSDKLWPYPLVDPIAVSGILVEGEGRRFVDEGMGGVYMANAIARLSDPLSAVAIFDQAIWDGPARERLVPPNPNLIEGGATIFRAPTIEQLRQQAGLGADLASTIDAYNNALARGRRTEMHPARSSSQYQPYPIAKEPFYAVPVCAGITYTMGGIAINGQSQVLRTDGSVIDGLYAAGTATGGVDGGPQIGYVGGLVRSGVTGLRAAETIAASLTV